MSIQITSIPVFPLPVCILIGGVTELRIFEPRYMRLVSEASSGQGFVISHYDSDKPFTSSDYGTLVHIIDFETLDGGMLGIKVQAQRMVSLSNFSQDDDGLHRANATSMEHWSGQGKAQFDATLAEPLENLITNHEELQGYFPTGEYTNLAWVCARYIELLPLSNSKKQQLVFQQDLTQCQAFLKALLQGEVEQGVETETKK
ncbi:MAG: LON peptidase substrate-binding domain-containing protein [Psychrobium sp.]